MTISKTEYVKWLILRPWKWKNVIFREGLRVLLSRIRIRLWGMYHISYYPKEVKICWSKINRQRLNKEGEINIWSFLGLPTQANVQLKHLKTRLAGVLISPGEYLEFLENKFEKNSSFDKEVFQSAHRFHWGVEWLAAGINEKAVEFIYQTIDIWISKNCTASDDEEAWQPYTVSERIVNWITIWCSASQSLALDDRRKIEFGQALIKQVLFLIDKLEYPASGIRNNHILNNGRAVYIAGRFLNDQRLSILGEKIIKSHIDEMVGPEGFLNESSSHYQFLLTRSMLECLKVARHTKDDSTVFMLEPVVRKMLEACTRLIPAGINTFEDLPRIGDVSPDIPFDWVSFQQCIESDQIKESHGWGTIWGEVEPVVNISASDLQNERAGWIRCDKSNWSLIAFGHPETKEYPVGHGHNDFGGFCLYDSGSPIFIDIGRFDYSATSSNGITGCEPSAHNVITLNGESVIPEGRGIFKAFSGHFRQLSQLDSLKIKEGILKWHSRGFSRIVPKTLWKRSISINENSITIDDVIETSSKKRLQVDGFLCLSPGIKCQWEKDRLSLVFDNRSYLVTNPQQSPLEIEPTDFFPEYGKKQGTNRLHWSFEFEGLFKNTVIIHRV